MEERIGKLETMISTIRPANQSIKKACIRRWDGIAKPIHGLGRMEDMITKIACIQENIKPDIKNRVVLVLCADNGVVSEGVTQTDSSVTAVVAENFAKGIASINHMADVAGVQVIPVDMGVASDLKVSGIVDRKIAYGTGNILREAAMTKEEAAAALLAGIDLVGEYKEKGCTILATGEMGIGNTTTSSAVASVLLGLSPEEVTGRGAGLSEEGLHHKTEVIRKAVQFHHPDPENPLEVLEKLGGFDMGGMAGVFLGGAIFHVPVVIDGLISSVAALIAARLCPACIDYMLPSHLGGEPASKKIMKELGLDPVIHAELALGEGTGAVMLFPLLDMAEAVYNENSTFEDIHISAYEKYDRF